jgi:hypothetical protein
MKIRVVDYSITVHFSVCLAQNIYVHEGYLLGFGDFSVGQRSNCPERIKKRTSQCISNKTLRSVATWIRGSYHDLTFLYAVGRHHHPLFENSSPEEASNSRKGRGYIHIFRRW